MLKIAEYAENKRDMITASIAANPSPDTLTPIAEAVARTYDDMAIRIRMALGYENG